MKQGYQNRLNMWKVSRNYLQSNSAAWSGSAPVNDYMVRLNAAITAAEAALLGQAGTSTGITQDKDALEETALELVVNIAASAAAYANDTYNNTLLAAVNYSRHDLLHQPEDELAAKMRSIVLAAQAVPAPGLIDYEVAAGDYAVATDAIAAFETAAPMPRGAIAGKAAVTQSIPAIMKDGTKALGQIDRLAKRFDRNMAGFSAGYKSARVVVDAGHRHQTPPATP